MTRPFSIRLPQNLEKFVESESTEGKTKTDVILACLNRIRQDMELGIIKTIEPKEYVEINFKTYQKFLDVLSREAFCLKAQKKLPTYRLPCFEACVENETSIQLPANTEESFTTKSCEVDCTVLGERNELLNFMLLAKFMLRDGH